MKILIIDDREVDRKLSEAHCRNLGYDNLIFADTYKLALEQIETHKPDLLLCDFNLDQSYTGVDVLRDSNLDPGTGVIVITNMYEDEVYRQLEEIRPILFLAKGFASLDLKQGIAYIAKSKEGNDGDSDENAHAESPLTRIKERIYVKIGNKYRIIKIKDVNYIEADGKYLNLHIEDKKYSLRFSLSKMLEVLPENFMRVHGSYIINADFIEEIKPNDNLVTLNGRGIPFSRNYRKDLLDHFSF